MHNKYLFCRHEQHQKDRIYPWDIGQRVSHGFAGA